MSYTEKEIDAWAITRALKKYYQQEDVIILEREHYRKVLEGRSLRQLLGGVNESNDLG